MSHPFCSIVRIAPPLFALAGLATVIFGLTGCVAPPVTYKNTADASAKVAAARRIVLVPPDVEVREISAGGVTEKRDDWSDLVSGNLTQALARAAGYAPAPTLDTAAKTELADTQALVRAIMYNHLGFSFGSRELSSFSKPLTYQVGSVDRLADACGADALLFVFARDAYSSGGRKALVALGFAVPAPAVTGAVLVGRDGTVLWFNYYFAQHMDLRESDGATDLAKELLAGLPRH